MDIDNDDKFDVFSGKSDTGKQFVRLLSAHQNSIFTFILSMVSNWSDAEDLMQDTAEVMWCKFEESQPIHNFPAWGIEIARRKVMNFYAKNKRRKTFLANDTLNDLADRASEFSSEIDERIVILRKCLSKMPEHQRNWLRMRYEQNLSIYEIAESVKVPTMKFYKMMGKFHALLLRCVRRFLVEEGLL